MSETPEVEPQETELNEAEFNKRFAERVLTRVDSHKSFAAEQVASTAKWLTASLLAVNSGGALAAVNVIKDGESWWPGLLFAMGIAFALLSAAALQEVYNGVGEPLLNHDNYWTEVTVRGTRDENTEAELQEASTQAMRFAQIPPILGWCSGVLFLTGVILLGVGTTRAESMQDRRCMVLQRDMLSANPKRPNSPELFKALGCRPGA